MRELELTADYLARKEEEKEAERAEKERLRDEAKARREFEAEKARLVKEQAHYTRALDQIRATGTPEEVAAAEATLAEIVDAIEGVEQREANIRAGYVYVISNVGSFGPGVVKIGMTRRFDARVCRRRRSRRMAPARERQTTRRHHHHFTRRLRKRR